MTGNPSRRLRLQRWLLWMWGALVIIDFHTHMHAPGMTQEDRLHIRTETVIEAARANGIDKTCISNPLHDLRRMDRARGLQEVSRRRVRQGARPIQDELIAFVTGVPWSGEEHLREVERAVKQDGFRGAIIPSSS
jgi:hypothetical protein